MEIAFNATKLQAAAYKIVKWEGDIEQAKKELGKQSDLEFSENRASFLKKIASWAISHHQNRLNQSVIKEGIPFVISGSKYIPLNQEAHFVFGEFRNYFGAYEDRWEVMTSEEMRLFLNIEGAIGYLHNLSDAKR